MASSVKGRRDTVVVCVYRLLGMRDTLYGEGGFQEEISMVAPTIRIYMWLVVLYFGKGLIFLQLGTL